MAKTPIELTYKRPRIAANTPEYGDARDVQRIFGIKESFTYYLWKTRQIKAVLIPGMGKTGGTGKRLFDFRSIRQLIAKQAKQEEENGRSA